MLRRKIEPNRLLRTAFKSFGTLSPAAIVELRNQYKAAVVTSLVAKATTSLWRQYRNEWPEANPAHVDAVSLELGVIDALELEDRAAAEAEANEVAVALIDMLRRSEVPSVRAQLAYARARQARSADGVDHDDDHDDGDGDGDNDNDDTPSS